MSVDMERIRAFAWKLAEIGLWYWEEEDDAVHYANYLTAAHDLRDLCDEVEMLQYGHSVFDRPLAKENRRLLQMAIDQAGGFFGPRSEIESHQRAEIEFLKLQYRRDTGNEPEAY